MMMMIVWMVIFTAVGVKISSRLMILWAGSSFVSILHQHIQHGEEVDVEHGGEVDNEHGGEVDNLRSCEAALCSAGRSVGVQTMSSRNSMLKFFKWGLPSKSCKLEGLLVLLVWDSVGVCAGAFHLFSFFFFSLFFLFFFGGGFHYACYFKEE